MLQKLANILDYILFFFASMGLLGSVGLAFAAVVMRYMFNFSLEWVEEGARYLALFAALLVAGPVARKGGHISLDIMTSELKGKAQEITRIITGLITLAISSAILFWGVTVAIQSYEFGMRTASLQFPQWIPFLIFPLGMIFLLIFSIVEILAASATLRKNQPSTTATNFGQNLEE